MSGVYSLVNEKNSHHVSLPSNAAWYTSTGIQNSTAPLIDSRFIIMGIQGARASSNDCVIPSVIKTTDMMALAQSSFDKVWLSPEEDEAWSDL